MIDWLVQNTATIAVILVIAVFCVFAVMRLVRNKKKGKSCSCGCDGCIHSGNCSKTGPKDRSGTKKL